MAAYGVQRILRAEDFAMAKMSMEKLARYIIRAFFSQERMTYHRESVQVKYRSKACPRPRSGNGEQTKVFDALEWIAAMCSHVPDKGEQMVRYYGYYSNASRGRRKKSSDRRSDTLYFGTGADRQGISEKLGAADTKGL